MGYNRPLIGKIRTYDNNTGLGEIVSSNGVFMFTFNDLKYSDIKPGDVVKFRAERVHDVNRAFFVNRIQLGYDLRPIKMEGQRYLRRKGNE